MAEDSCTISSWRGCLGVLSSCDSFGASAILSVIAGLALLIEYLFHVAESSETSKCNCLQVCSGSVVHEKEEETGLSEDKPPEGNTAHSAEEDGAE
ncbi:MAG: hypothetical protein ACFFC0_02300 [Promethearchaeota archaeon]